MFPNTTYASDRPMANEKIDIYKDQHKHVLHIEIRQENNSLLKREEVIEMVKKYMHEEESVTTETSYKNSDLPKQLAQHISQLKICELSSTCEQKRVNLCDVSTEYHVYKLDWGGPSVEDMGDADEKDVPAATHWLLPSSEFQNLWDTLIFETEVKEQLLNFVGTTLLFSDHGVDNNIITWNKVVLLHGPPGTGKTSLCKALAHKLSIRLRHRYQYGQLFEVNSHSLFSKWFSESGKLVQKLFSKITELVEDPESLVCVLIDEVESLTRTRAATASGADPSDALRVVNALLTQLDQIKRYPNVLILTTSNVTGTIDLAFVDRADIKQFIGLPSQSAAYQIYHSCLMELIKTKIIHSRDQLLTLRQLQIINMTHNDLTRLSLILWNISGESVGLSGRTLRKIPFLAHALHCQTPICSLPDFLEAMMAAVKKHKEDASLINDGS